MNYANTVKDMVRLKWINQGSTALSKHDQALFQPLNLKPLLHAKPRNKNGLQTAALFMDSII